MILIKLRGKSASSNPLARSGENRAWKESDLGAGINPGVRMPFLALYQLDIPRHDTLTIEPEHIAADGF
jgi:hypothetical protein